jgi:SAM-dependent methyltransferase
MATQDFVESTGRDKYWRMVEEELRLIQNENGMLRPELHRHVKCTICDIDDSTPVFIKEGFTFVKCNRCGLIYVNPQCETSRLNEYYDSGRSADIWVEVLLSTAEQDYDIRKFTKCCEDIEALTDGRKILDIGCSIGMFLKVARDRGWETTGLELNQRAYEYAKNTLGLDVRKQLLHEAGFAPESFNVVTLWEVLEHVPNPRDLIAQTHEILKPDGALALIVPNRNCLSARIMRHVCACFGGRNHLWYFSPDNLASLLEQTGYSVVRCSTQLSQIDEILTYLNYRNPYFEHRSEGDFDLAPELKAKLEKFIFDNDLGYKILMYAVRK